MDYVLSALRNMYGDEWRGFEARFEWSCKKYNCRTHDAKNQMKSILIPCN